MPIALLSWRTSETFRLGPTTLPLLSQVFGYLRGQPAVTTPLQRRRSSPIRNIGWQRHGPRLPEPWQFGRLRAPFGRSLTCLPPTTMSKCGLRALTLLVAWGIRKRVQHWSLRCKVVRTTFAFAEWQLSLSVFSLK